jgi:uncharacterized protein
MNTSGPTTWIAFVGARRIASGTPRDVASRVKGFVELNSDAMVLVFDAVSSRPIELDLRGSLSNVLKRLPADSSAGLVPDSDAQLPTVRTPGRPKLGVVAREVTLLPRHWEWLSRQPGGASVALRKLVEQGQRARKHDDEVREAREAAYRFMSAIAGNEPGFEEATRALYADDPERLRQFTSTWPRDIRLHAQQLADEAFRVCGTGETMPADSLAHRQAHDLRG